MCPRLKLYVCKQFLIRKKNPNNPENPGFRIVRTHFALINPCRHILLWSPPSPFLMGSTHLHCFELALITNKNAIKPKGYKFRIRLPGTKQTLGPKNPNRHAWSGHQCYIRKKKNTIIFTISTYTKFYYNDDDDFVAKQ